MLNLKKAIKHFSVGSACLHNVMTTTRSASGDSESAVNENGNVESLLGDDRNLCDCNFISTPDNHVRAG